MSKLRFLFWISFIFVPIFTDFLSYQWLPQEYDSTRHTLLDSHSVACGVEGLNSCEMPDVWKDNATGSIYKSSDFKSHRREQALRISIYTFLYGLLACFFYAWDSTKAQPSIFRVKLKTALLYNLIFSLIFFIVI
jgi:hypothetical protein